ncbi:hypothetical protein [Lachnoclostridium sp. Marseille-P6806]|uniref:hypothetical protein n=1 Tax=Lachnoclostridium sp. Marseille-P6806 TaxID=2364793 RepID=UPI0010305F32|nr:hypothetical protein [Lachnoclostridium sp. Marseille-P6806]
MTEIGNKTENGMTEQDGTAASEAALSSGNATAEPLPSLSEIADERERLAQKRERRHVVSLSVLLALLIALAAILVGLLTGVLPV